MSGTLALAGFFLGLFLYWIAAFAALSLSDYGYSRKVSVAVLIVGFLAAAVAGVFGLEYITA